ncbi:hypothetical protein CIK75_01970 [Glutamicibacter sp. BW78]|nr:hypothetical protein CIK75_01970 [Glutamicibacter sp. BW78]
MFGPAPTPELFSPSSRAAAAEGWEQLSSRATELSRSATAGVGIARVLGRAREILLRGDGEEIAAALEEKKMGRAFITLWNDEPHMATSTLRAAPLEMLANSPHRLSRMATAGLLMVHLRYFSRLDHWQPGLLAALSSLITYAVAQLESKPTRRDAIEYVRSHADLVLDTTAPETVARNLIQNGRSLDDFLDEAGLPGFDGGDYGEQIRLWYYIQQIHEADPTADHDFLTELTRSSVFKAPVQDGYFGHKILQAMADKNQKPGPAWLDTILTIAKDPRLEHTSDWFEWWKPLPQWCIDRVKSWLSAQDLGLFLAAVEEYGIRSGQEDLQRMFPGRKAFLEGLLGLGLIKETRLILGNQAHQYVHERLGKSLRSDIAMLKQESQKSIIFVDCGDFHLVEGSHNFRLWVYVGKPAQALKDRRKTTFTPGFLRADIPRNFLHTNVAPAAYVDITHQGSENGTWQFKAMDFLIDHDIWLPEKKLLDPHTYRNYAVRFGIRRPAK